MANLENLESIETIETTEAAAPATETTAAAETKKFGVAEYGILVAAGYGAYCAVTDASKFLAKQYKKFKERRAAKKAAAAAEAQAQNQAQAQTAEKAD